MRFQFKRYGLAYITLVTLVIFVMLQRTFVVNNEQHVRWIKKYYTDNSLPCHITQGINAGQSKHVRVNNSDDDNKNDNMTTASIQTLSLQDYINGAMTGNPLIDLYGQNDRRLSGENGRGIVLSDDQKDAMLKVVQEFKINILVSDDVPLNRLVPDSRLPGCSDIKYNISTLPTVSVIIPFFDEWPSILLRTVYSIINRTPRRLIKDIILIDDNSTLSDLKGPLDDYVRDYFPRGLVKVLRMPQRKGLSSARMVGVNKAEGEVLVFFDSHMEVNIDWLPPLLTEIVKDRKVAAMAMLDYIKWETLEYHFDRFWMVKYGWDWRLHFFETYFRPDEVGQKITDPRPGSAMVGAAFAMDKTYFNHLGGYDLKMSIWGGENLEMTWRVTLCGGRLVHLPCSKIGHIARAQPYVFPGGRVNMEFFNLKRAITVWMGNYTRFVNKQISQLQTVDPGDLTDRYKLKARLQCKDFKWHMAHSWPELNIYDEDVHLWGQVFNAASNKCFDNDDYIFQMKEKLYLRPCKGETLHKQGFSLTKTGRLRTTLQCVIESDGKAMLQDCISGPQDMWTYDGSHLIHRKSKLCIEAAADDIPIVLSCNKNNVRQKWTWIPFDLKTR